MRVVASDQGIPPQQATAIVYVTVRRNLQKPKFEPNSVSLRILETQEVGASLVTMQASDSDREVKQILNIQIFLKLFFEFLRILEHRQQPLLVRA